MTFTNNDSISFEFRNNDGLPTGFFYKLPSNGTIDLLLPEEVVGTKNAAASLNEQALLLLCKRIAGSRLTLHKLSYLWKREKDPSFNAQDIPFESPARGSAREFADSILSTTHEINGAIVPPTAFFECAERLRLSFSSDPSPALLIRTLGWGYLAQARSKDERIPVAEFRRVSSEHIWKAVQQLIFENKTHDFGKSTHYDVCVEDDSLLPPKAVFGIAASEALAFDMRPGYFTGGIDTPCFSAILKAGFEIKRKGSANPPSYEGPNPEDKSWTEGRPLRISHLKRERARGLSPAKIAAFRREHGRLFCERCFLDPIEKYGALAGESCIEVHHVIPLSKLQTAETRTFLSDLKCYCANCHRIVHREMQLAER